MRADALGRLTLRPLPIDASIDELAEEDRAVIALVWGGRSRAEARAASSFQVIADCLAGDDALGPIARRAVDDERRHSEICRRVACAYAGREVPAPAPDPIEPPDYPGVSDELRATLHIAGMCAVNETTGSAFLERCLQRATGPLARAALRELLADEVDHARIGWAHLARLDAARRAETSAWLPPLLAANLRRWRERPILPARPALAAHGCPPWSDVDDAVVAAMRELVIPGFAHVGLDIRSAQAWLAAGASIDGNRDRDVSSR